MLFIVSLRSGEVCVYTIISTGMSLLLKLDWMEVRIVRINKNSPAPTHNRDRLDWIAIRFDFLKIKKHIYPQKKMDKKGISKTISVLEAGRFNMVIPKVVIAKGPTKNRNNCLGLRICDQLILLINWPMNRPESTIIRKAILTSNHGIFSLAMVYRIKVDKHQYVR